MSTDVQGRRRTRNPYLGPQSFDRGDVLYGRDVETEELLDLVIAERIVLLYSPSGAGKTSLIQAGLAPRLEAEGLEVLPIIRVTRELPPGSALAGPPRNRYVLSTLLSLEKGLPKELQRDVGELDRMSLAEYLAQRPDVDGRPGNEVLVFDQFEEVVTADPVDQDVKRGFFAEVGAALRDRGVWALFAAREDFLAELDSYARPIPTRLARRYRLSLLTVGQALQAAIGPAADAGVEFRRPAAQQLVDDLARIRVQRPDGVTEVPGRTVEPVQLQVTCRQLWDELPGDATVIDVADVAALGDVDAALATYYAAAVARVAAASGVSERAVRDWFEHALVTPQGIRGQVLQGPEHGPAGAETVRMLTDAHLVRAESHRGATWYELAHDRLIEPVQADNARWREHHLSPLERQAAQWDEQSRADRLLLVGPELRAAEAGAGAAVQGREREFLEASQTAQKRAQREQRANRLMRVFLVLAVIGCLVAAGATVQAYDARGEAVDARWEAVDVARAAEAAAAASFDVDLSLLLGQEAAARSAADGDPLGAETRDALQLAVGASPVVTVLRGHGPATAAVHSGDGSSIATYHDDGSIVVWDAATGEERLVLDQPDGGLMNDESLDLSADGSRLAAAAADGSAVVWDLGSGRTQPVSVRPHSASNAYDVAFSPDGTVLASVGNVGVSVVELVGLPPPRPLATPSAVGAPGPRRTGFDEGPSQALDAYEVEWSLDGRQLLVTESTGAVSVWDATTGAFLRQQYVHPSRATALDVSASGLVVSASAEGVVTTDVATGAVLHPLDLTDTVDVSISADGSRFAALDRFGAVAVVDAANGQALRYVSVSGSSPTTIDLDPADATRAVVSGGPGAPAVWDLTVGHADLESAIESMADGSVTTASYDGSVITWAPDGTLRTLLPPSSDPIEDAELSDDGLRVAVVRTSGAVELWSTDTAEQLLATSVDDTLWSVALSPDGTSVAAGGYLGEVWVWAVATGELTATLGDHTGAVVSLEYGRDARQLVSASQDQNVIVWDLDFETPEHRVRLDSVPTSVAWAPDGGTIAVGSDDGTVQLLAPDLSSDRKDAARAHAKRVDDLAFDATGERLASGSDDRTVIVWNVATGTVLRRIRHDAAAYRVAFAAHEDQVLVGDNGSVPAVLWLDEEELLRLAEQRTTRELTDAECRSYLYLDECPAD